MLLIGRCIEREWCVGTCAYSPNGALTFTVMEDGGLPHTETVAGAEQSFRSGSIAEGVCATAASILRPGRLSFDPSGDLLETEGGSIWSISGGKISTVTALPGSVISSADGAPLNQFAAGFITGLAFDASGNMYISSGNLVQMVSGGLVFTIAGNPSATQDADNVNANSVPLTNAGDLAADASGNVYVLTGTRVRMIANDIITTVAVRSPAASTRIKSPPYRLN